MHQDILDHQAKLQDLFDEANRLYDSGSIGTDLFVQLTWYLCVRTSGYLENSVQIILLEYVQSKTTDIATQNYVQNNLNFINADYGSILNTVRRFNENWKTSLRQNNVQQYRSVLKNLMESRNRIAHGKDSKITIQELQGYFTQIQNLVLLLHNTCQ